MREADEGTGQSSWFEWDERGKSIPSLQALWQNRKYQEQTDQTFQPWSPDLVSSTLKDYLWVLPPLCQPLPIENLLLQLLITEPPLTDSLCSLQ